ncbi:MAG: hypothetical protein CW694_02955 [Candidatus Syntrophoarchaeum sp. WYZ-LMO15]|nr:MAG: hypothetical protein CW694_02955 [Candidatus Syntrophoarchaeum sp. WYZ-LMO15]
MAGISRLIQAPEYEIKILIISDIFQSAESCRGRISREYQDLSAVVYLDKEDMKAWSIKDGMNVTLFNENGKIVVTGRSSKEEHRGIGLMPPSIYSMRLASFDETSGAIPLMIDARIRRGDGEVTGIRELCKKI